MSDYAGLNSPQSWWVKGEAERYLNEKENAIGSFSNSIRESEISKTPFMIILGEKEVQSQTVSLRKHQKGDIGSFDLRSVVKLINSEIKESKAAFKV